MFYTCHFGNRFMYFIKWWNELCWSVKFKENSQDKYNMFQMLKTSKTQLLVFNYEPGMHRDQGAS
jgi:hypothetical protein